MSTYCLSYNGEFDYNRSKINFRYLIGVDIKPVIIGSVWFTSLKKVRKTMQVMCEITSCLYKQEQINYNWGNYSAPRLGVLNNYQIDNRLINIYIIDIWWIIGFMPIDIEHTVRQLYTEIYLLIFSTFSTTSYPCEKNQTDHNYRDHDHAGHNLTNYNRADNDPKRCPCRP